VLEQELVMATTLAVCSLMSLHPLHLLLQVQQQVMWDNYSTHRSWQAWDTTHVQALSSKGCSFYIAWTIRKGYT